MHQAPFDIGAWVVKRQEVGRTEAIQRCSGKEVGEMGEKRYIGTESIWHFVHCQQNCPPTQNPFHIINLAFRLFCIVLLHIVVAVNDLLTVTMLK